MNNTSDVVITGLGLEIPGAATDTVSAISPADLRPGAFDPKIRVAKKGIRYKDHATLLSMSAGWQAILDAKLPDDPEKQVEAPRFGVVVTCNLGNIDTVANVARTIRNEHVNAASAMDLPNASSNVIASSLAIRHGLQGPNLMVCNGATSSLDALHLAANCIRSGRADRMLVVGVEVHNDVVAALPDAAEQWFNGAVAVVIESRSSAQSRGARILGKIGAYSFSKEIPDVAASIDVTPHLGHSYGAEGLLQIAALMQEKRDGGDFVLMCGHKFGDSVSSKLELQCYSRV